MPRLALRSVHKNNCAMYEESNVACGSAGNEACTIVCCWCMRTWKVSRTSLTLLDKPLVQICKWNMFRVYVFSSVWGGPNFSAGVHILQKNKFRGVLIYQKISSGGNHFWGVHFYHDKPHPVRKPSPLPHLASIFSAFHVTKNTRLSTPAQLQCSRSGAWEPGNEAKPNTCTLKLASWNANIYRTESLVSFVRNMTSAK